MKFFNSLIEFSLKNRLFIIGIAIVLMVYGGYVGKNLPIDVLPNLNRPTVTLLTEAHGMAPEEVETLVTWPLETAMNGAPGVQRVRSNSGVGLSLVFVEFGWDTDIYTARQLVQERLQLAVESLPNDVSTVMGPISSVMGEIMLIGISCEDDSIDPVELRSIAEYQVGLRLQTISGVSQVLAIGGGLKQYEVQAIPERMAALGVSMEEVQAAAAGSQGNTTGGFLNNPNQEFMIRNIGRSNQIEDLANTVVKQVAGQSILLSDVAEIKFGKQIMRGDAGVNGKKAVILGVQKQPTADTTRLSKDIEQALKDMQLSLPEKLDVEILFRQANFIENAIHNVKDAIRDGAIMVAIILFLFLLNFRTTFITLTAIPLSFVITLIYFKISGTSINTMTLGGLAVAIGMVVDDAIVDVENVFRRLRENQNSNEPKKTLEVIAAASREIRGSIFFATTIIILVFIPLFGLGGIEGRLFAPIAEATIVSMIASFFVALTVIPALCSLLLPSMKHLKEEKDSLLIRIIKNFSRRFLIKPTLKYPIATMILSVICAILSFSLYPIMGKEFLPPFNEGTAIVMLQSAPGTSLKQSNRIGLLAEQLLLEVPEVKSVGRRTGRAEKDEHAEGIHTNEMDVEFHDSSRTRTEILDDVRFRLEQIPGTTMNIGQPISHRLDHMLSGVQAQIAIKLFGSELDILRSKANEMQSIINQVEGAVDVQIEKQVLIPQVRIEVDREKARIYGVQVGKLNDLLEMALGGENVSQILDGQIAYNIFVRYSESSRNSIESIRNTLIETANGTHVPLYLIAEIRQSKGPNLINRENAQRRIVISANVSEQDLESVVKEIREQISEQLELPTGYFVSYEGQFQTQQEASKRIMTLSAFVLAAIFILLYSQFKSLNLVLQILTSIPMAFIGGILASWIVGENISIASLVGLITLAGIASRNTIMLISHYLHLMDKEGEKFTKEMIIRGTLERLTPVLMTALTAGLALIPLVLAADQPGKEILYPVALVIIGGLFTSTLLTAIVTPAIFLTFGEKPSKHFLKNKNIGESCD